MSSYTKDDMEHLCYPIGRFAAKENRTADERSQDIQKIGRLSADLSEAVRPLTTEQLDTPYRPGGWSVAQVVHHLADTNMFACLRFKRGLTEDAPQIPTYRQDLWAERSDYLDETVDSSLGLLEQLNRRFMTLLGSLSEAEFERVFVSAGLGTMNLDTALQRYIWHNSHHIAQITSLIRRSGW